MYIYVYIYIYVCIYIYVYICIFDYIILDPTNMSSHVKSYPVFLDAPGGFSHGFLYPGLTDPRGIVVCSQLLLVHFH